LSHRFSNPSPFFPGPVVKHSKTRRIPIVFMKKGEPNAPFTELLDYSPKPLSVQVRQGPVAWPFPSAAQWLALPLILLVKHSLFPELCSPIDLFLVLRFDQHFVRPLFRRSNDAPRPLPKGVCPAYPTLLIRPVVVIFCPAISSVDRYFLFRLLLYFLTSLTSPVPIFPIASTSSFFARPS